MRRIEVHVRDRIDFGTFDFARGLNWLIDSRQRRVRPLLDTAGTLVLRNSFYALKAEETAVIERFGQ